MINHIPLNNGKNRLHWQNEQYCSGSTYFTEICRLILFRLRWTSSQWRSNFATVSENAIKSNLILFPSSLNIFTSVYRRHKCKNTMLASLSEAAILNCSEKNAITIWSKNFEGLFLGCFWRNVWTRFDSWWQRKWISRKWHCVKRVRIGRCSRPYFH